MTIEEINNLDIEKHKMTLAVRLFNKMPEHPQPPKIVSHDFDYIEWTIAQISEDDFISEFELYKEELRLDEIERLRKTDIEDRFKNLKDMRAAFHTMFPDISNPAVFLRDLMNNKDHSEAESVIQQLEVKDLDLAPSAEDIAKTEWVSDINRELAIENISRDGLLEALVRKEFLGDSSYIDALKPKIKAIHERKPRP